MTKTAQGAFDGGGLDERILFVGPRIRRHIGVENNDPHYDQAAAQFGRFTFAGGKQLAGLVTRRAAETALFNA